MIFMCSSFSRRLFSSVVLVSAKNFKNTNQGKSLLKLKVMEAKFRIRTRRMCTRRMSTRRISTRRMCTRRISTRRMCTRRISTRLMCTRRMCTRRMSTRRISTRRKWTRQNVTDPEEWSLRGGVSIIFFNTNLLICSSIVLCLSKWLENWVQLYDSVQVQFWWCLFTNNYYTFNTHRNWGYCILQTIMYSQYKICYCLPKADIKGNFRG